MSRLYYIIIGAIVCCGVIYLYVHRVEFGLVPPSSSTATPESETSPTTSQSTAPLTPARIVWTQVDRSKDGFRLELPTDVKETQVPAYNERGGTEQVEMLYAYPDAYTSFSVAWEDEPPVERVSGNKPDNTLDMARDDALSRTQATLISETRANRLGYPARDFIGRNAGGGVFNARLILVGRRLYMLIAAFNSERTRGEDDVNHFFDSFHVTGRN